LVKFLGEEYYGLVVGKSVDKEFTNHLKEKETNNFRIIERFVPNDEIQVYMNACDVVVLPYTEISTSGATMLAYAFSKPVVASRVGCMGEIVTDETGILVKSEDANTLAEGIKELFSKDYEQMGKNAYKMAIEKYNWDVMIDKTIRGYESLIDNNKRVE